VTAVRDRIYRHVAANPGTHFNELARELDLATGQAQYHLEKLGAAGEVVAEPLYGRTHYYTSAYDAPERGVIAVLRRETARDVLCYLVAAGPSAPASVATDLGIARSTLEWHLDHLLEQDLVEKRRGGDGVTLVLTHPEATRQAIQLIEPSLPERFVDRFVRLLDRLVEE
jgi:predicted transcriptional regulator